MEGYLLYSWVKGVGVLRDPYGHRISIQSGNSLAALSECKRRFEQAWPRYYSPEIRFQHN